MRFLSVIVLVLCIGSIGLTYSLKTSNKLSNSQPPKGLYIVVRNDVIQQTAETLSLEIANGVNNFTMPTYSGGSGDTTYQFSQFGFSIDMEGPTITSPNGAPEVVVSWSLFQFLLTFNYHVCNSGTFNLCERGVAEIFTTTFNVSLSAALTVDTTGPTVSVSADSVEMGFQPEDIEIVVECTDTWCIIPTDDIANAIAGEFVTIFNSSLVTAINNATNTYLNGISTSFNLPAYDISLNLNGDFDFFPESNPNWVFYVDGDVQPDGKSVNPPFSPQFSPPDSVFATPPGELNFVFTDYLLQEGLWALDVTGDMNFTVTNSELPANSPIHLTTNDAAMQSAVPQLRSYPNMDINVEVYLANLSSIQITGNPGTISNVEHIVYHQGINMHNTFYTHFVLTNETLTLNGWDLLMDVSFDVKISTLYNTTTHNVDIKPSIGQIATSADLIKSWIGDVNSRFFSTILEFVLSAVSTTLMETISVPTPEGFTVGSPEYNEAAGYGIISSAITYSVVVPSNVCTNSTTPACPEGNTCCTWGCCLLENGVCCDSGGCCPQGWICYQGDCYPNN